MAATSASTRILSNVKIPATAHAPIICNGDPSSPAISADLIKMTEPITLPTTSAVAVLNPMVLSKVPAMFLLHILRDEPMEMMCALFSGHRVTTMIVKPGPDTLLYCLHYLLVFQFDSVEIATGA